jgi:hypothetical protein
VRPPEAPVAASGSTRMLSTVMAGLSEEYGSWKTTWMSRATLRRRAREMLLIGSPRKLMLPPVTGASPRIARPIVVFPDPDSPTRLSVSPAAISKETSSMTVLPVSRRPP